MNQNIGLGVVLAVAVAAARLVGGGSGAATNSSQALDSKSTTTIVSQGHKKMPTAATRYHGGCTVFDPAAKPLSDPKTDYPRDANRGAVRSLVGTFFHLEDSAPAGPAATLRNKPAVRYAIALMPDPRHTNLGLLFDRQMVALQQAAQDDGYTYNSSWFPWKTDSQAWSRVEDQQRADDDTDQREACPGILLFRKSISALQPGSQQPVSPSLYDQSLVILLVGEQPTGGLNEDQWANAILWLQNNASSYEPSPTLHQDLPRALSIIGPSFSGSLSSLQRDLAALPAAAAASAAATFPTATTPIRILSGAVRSCSSSRWFQQNIAPNALFASFQENDDLQIYRLLNYLKQQGTEPSDVAIVSEDETAYADTYTPIRPAAQDLASPCNFAYARASRPVLFSYPRDISALRTAYEKQSVFSAGLSARNIHPILQESADLGGPTTASDTVPAYSGSNGPVAQEAVLYGIVSNLRAHHARYLVLRSTNPLDYLFLTRFFHRAYPEGRVVTIGSDLLYRREIDTTEFRGVLALSNYPLLPINQHWTYLTEQGPNGRPSPHTHRIPESYTEGTYLAGRYLFDPNIPWDDPALQQVNLATHQPVTLHFKEDLADFADPFWMHDSPRGPKTIQAPGWLSVVGRDGYWPVALLNDHSTPTSFLNRETTEDKAFLPPPLRTMLQLTSSRAHYDLNPRNPAHVARSLLFTAPRSWWICLGAAVMLLAYQLYVVAYGKRHRSMGLCAPFRTLPNASQAMLLGINCAFAVSLLLNLLSICLPLLSAHSVFRNPLELLFLFALWLALFLILLRMLYRCGTKGRRIAAFTLALGTLVIAAAHLFAFAPNLGPADNVPLFYRMGHLTGGASPLLPLLFLLFGFYLWTWQALSGNALLGAGRPLLPELHDPPAPTPLRFWQYWRTNWYGALLGVPVAIQDQHAATVKDSCLYRISHELGKRIVRVASPLCVNPEIVALPFFLLLGALAFLSVYGPPLLSLESVHFAWVVNLVLLLGFLLTITEAARLYLTWVELRRLLTALSRLRLRRTFARIRAVDNHSLWSVSGSVQRVQYLFFSQQLDAAHRLAQLPGGNLPRLLFAITRGDLFAQRSSDQLSTGPLWDQPLLLINGSPVYIREVFNSAVADVLNHLHPHWVTEEESLSLENSAAPASDGERNVFDMKLSDNPTIRTAEEFVCFHYIAFIQNVLARMKTMILSMICLFVTVCLSISFYPFVPRTGIGMWMMVNLLLIAASVIYVYAGMERDETLSYITNTRPGRLSTQFYLKTAGFLAGPVLGLLTTQFPSIAESILGWLQPGIDALK